MQDKHKSAKEAALKKLVTMMDEHGVEDLKGLKAKPIAAEVSVTKVAPKDAEAGDDEPFQFGKTWDTEDENEGGENDADAGPEPSPEEKSKIAELYHRYCK